MSDQPNKPVTDNAPLDPAELPDDPAYIEARADALYEQGGAMQAEATRLFKQANALRAVQNRPAAPTKSRFIANVAFTDEEREHLRHAISIAAALNDDGLLILQDSDSYDPGEEFFACVKIIARALARMATGKTAVDYTGQ